MDAFKQVEIERMRLGGNQGWRDFFDQHEDTKMRGISWDDATIAERYSGEVGEEWKERLTAQVEGRAYVPGEKKPASTASSATAAKDPSRTGTPLGGSAAAGSRSDSPGAKKVRVDDKYFSKLGAENASRSEHLPPSQGGKYGGFGNMPASEPRAEGSAPTWDELQKDPMAGLTKGFGWFTSTVSRTAKNVNDGYIQPTAKQVGTLATHLLICLGGRMADNINPLRSGPSPTLRSKPTRPQVNLGAWRNRVRAMPTTASTVLSTDHMRAGPITGKRQWTRAGGVSGTTFPTWPTSSEARPRVAGPSARLPWARGEPVPLVALRRQQRRTSGMTGDWLSGDGRGRDLVDKFEACCVLKEHWRVCSTLDLNPLYLID